MAASFRPGSADRGGPGSTRRRKKNAEAQDPETATESAEIARLRAESGELRAENEFLKKRRPCLRKNVGERAPQGSSAAKRAAAPSPPCARWSECRSPDTTSRLGRPDSATKVKRRKPTLMVESELGASDMILRVPARPPPHCTARAWWSRRTRSAPVMREKDPVSRATAPQGSAPPHRADDTGHPPQPRGPGIHRPAPRTQMGRGYHLYPHVGRVRAPGRRPGLLLPEKVIGYAMADNMRTDLICDATGYGRAPLPPSEDRDVLPMWIVLGFVGGWLCRGTRHGITNPPQNPGRSSSW